MLHFRATEIKRIWRGYKGREAARWVKHQSLTDAERAYYDQMATQIQKVYRGRLSRQQKQDFYRRKQYVDHVTAQSAKLTAANEANVAKLKEYLQTEAEEQKGKEFVAITQDLHHLVGTSHIPGVFNSRYGEQFSTTAYGIPLESHIRENVSNKIHASNQLKATKPPRRKNKAAVMGEAPTKRISRKKKNSKKEEAGTKSCCGCSGGGRFGGHNSAAACTSTSLKFFGKDPGHESICRYVCVCVYVHAWGKGDMKFNKIVQMEHQAGVAQGSIGLVHCALNSKV